ncbi:hypothetical protein ACRALDRAFT_207745 [Sodiomyces alcalophilus JCM 7366]|uniref:uncharacterized protein n=1 Tax=Sodiomyces alcalophilus JCM 7366 TaxID=591952 RepID=UPI0039B4A6FB
MAVTCPRIPLFPPPAFCLPLPWLLGWPAGTFQHRGGSSTNYTLSSLSDTSREKDENDRDEMTIMIRRGSRDALKSRWIVGYPPLSSLSLAMRTDSLAHYLESPFWLGGQRERKKQMVIKETHNTCFQALWHSLMDEYRSVEPTRANFHRRYRVPYPLIEIGSQKTTSRDPVPPLSDTTTRENKQWASQGLQFSYTSEASTSDTSATKHSSQPCISMSLPRASMHTKHDMEELVPFVPVQVARPMGRVI